MTLCNAWEKRRQQLTIAHLLKFPTSPTVPHLSTFTRLLVEKDLFMSHYANSPPVRTYPSSYLPSFPSREKDILLTNNSSTQFATQNPSQWKKSHPRSWLPALHLILSPTILLRTTFLLDPSQQIPTEQEQAKTRQQKPCEDARPGLWKVLNSVVNNRKGVFERSWGQQCPTVCWKSLYHREENEMRNGQQRRGEKNLIVTIPTSFPPFTRYA